MPAQLGRLLVGAYDDRHRVPAEDRAQAPLDRGIAGLLCLALGRNRVDVRGVEGRDRTGAGVLGTLDRPSEQIASTVGPVVRDNCVNRVEPFAGLNRVEVGCCAIGTHALDLISHLLCDGTHVITADEDLAFAGPAAQAEAVRAGEVQPRELVELCLRRIEALNPRLNAFRVTMAEDALSAAERQSDSDGLLAGVPVGIKDEMAVGGQTLTRGSHSYGPPESADSEIVRRLRAAGAIPIGITNVPELMTWPWTASDANGITRNP